jgi:hypothetical protein
MIVDGQKVKIILFINFVNVAKIGFKKKMVMMKLVIAQMDFTYVMMEEIVALVGIDARHVKKKKINVHYANL